MKLLRSQTLLPDSKSISAWWISKICILLQAWLSTTTLFQDLRHLESAESTNPTSNTPLENPFYWRWTCQCQRMIRKQPMIHSSSLGTVSILSSTWCTPFSGLPSLSPSLLSHWWSSIAPMMVLWRNLDIYLINSLSETWEVPMSNAIINPLVKKNSRLNATTDTCSPNSPTSEFWAPN